MCGVHVPHTEAAPPGDVLRALQACGVIYAYGQQAFPPACYPFETGCLPLSCSGNPGVNDGSHRGANWKRLGQRAATTSSRACAWGTLAR